MLEFVHCKLLFPKRRLRLIIGICDADKGRVLHQQV